MEEKTIGQRLRECRGNRTCEEVAAAIGVTRQALNHYEHDIRVPRDQIKVRIAKYYGKSIEELFFCA